MGADELEAGDGVIDSILDMFIAILVTLLLVFLVSLNLQQAYKRHYKAERDKVEVTYEVTSYPFEFTAYQAYMMGFMMDNHEPARTHGVTYTQQGKTVKLAPETFNYNYSTRNTTITSRGGDSVYNVLSASGFSGDQLVEHYRGLLGEPYVLELSGDLVTPENVYAPNGVTILERDRKEFIWTVFGLN